MNSNVLGSHLLISLNSRAIVGTYEIFDKLYGEERGVFALAGFQLEIKRSFQSHSAKVTKTLATVYESKKRKTITKSCWNETFNQRPF